MCRSVDDVLTAVNALTDEDHLRLYRVAEWLGEEADTARRLISDAVEATRQAAAAPCSLICWRSGSLVEHLAWIMQQLATGSLQPACAGGP